MHSNFGALPVGPTGADALDFACGLQDLAFRVAGQVVHDCGYGAELFSCCGLGQAYQRNLRVRIGHRGHEVIGRWRRIQGRDPFGDSDALPETPVRQLRARDDIPDREYTVG